MSPLPEAGNHRPASRLSVVPAPVADSLDALVLSDLVRCSAIFREHADERRGVDLAHADIVQLEDDLRRVRNNLVLLDCIGGVIVVEELLTLLAAHRAGTTIDEMSFANFLPRAGEALSRYSRELQLRGADEIALSLVPLLNDSRASRGERVFSAALLHAVGVDELLRGAESDESELSVLVFESALVLIDTLGPEGVDESPARRQIFLTLARWLATGEVPIDVEGMAGKGDGGALAVGSLTLCLELLYEVARLDPDDERASALQTRFTLPLVAPRPPVASSPADGHAPVMESDANVITAVHVQLCRDISRLSDALEQPDGCADGRRLQLAREQLGGTERVASLLGAHEVRTGIRRCLGVLDDALAELASESSLSAPRRRTVVQSLDPLRRATFWMQALPRSVDEANEPRSDLLGDSELNEQERQADGHEGRWSGVEAARCMLREVERDLSGLHLVGSSPVDDRWQQIEQALRCTDLPDVVPALQTLRVLGAPVRVAPSSAQRALSSRLIATLDLYLGCIQQTGPNRQNLVRDAEKSLERLGRQLKER